MFEIGEMSISMLYGALVILNFSLAEKIYDTVLNEFFTRNSVFLHDLKSDAVSLIYHACP